MMMLSECALVILLDEIIEAQKGLDWVKNSSELQYETSTGVVGNRGLGCISLQLWFTCGFHG